MAMITVEEWSSARRSKLLRVSTGWCMASVFAVVASSALGGDSVLQELLVRVLYQHFTRRSIFKYMEAVP